MTNIGYCPFDTLNNLKIVLECDFDLDYLEKHCINYSSGSLFKDFEETLSDLNLIN